MRNCSCSTNERNETMGNGAETVTGKIFTGHIYNSPNACNIVDIRSDGCNRVGVKNFVTGMTATLERVTGYGVNVDIVTVYDNRFHKVSRREVFNDLSSYHRFQLIGMLEDMTK